MIFTATTMGFGSVPAPRPIPITFNVDHPFAYAIYHSASNTVLFQGHVTSLPPSTKRYVEPVKPGFTSPLFTNMFK